MWLELFGATLAPEKVAEPIKTYPPRASRYRLEVDVTFIGEDSRCEGRAINVSASGLLAKFDHPPELWTNGRLEMEAGEHYLSLPVRVARAQGNEVGFAFFLESENDRASIDILILAVIDHPLLD